MTYKLFIDDLDTTVKESIQWLLNDNIDSMGAFEGLEIDVEHDEEEDYI